MATQVWRRRRRTVLGLGSKGLPVARLQQRLQSLGYDVGAIDGVYGFLTEDCVCSLQREHGIRVDGVAGPEVMELLRDYELQGERPMRMVWGTVHGDVSRKLKHQFNDEMRLRLDGLLLYCFSVADDGEVHGEIPEEVFSRGGSVQVELIPVISNFNQDIYDELSLEALLRHGHTRRRFVVTVRGILQNPKIDGIALDLQRIGLGFGRRFGALMHEVRGLVNQYRKKMYMVLVPTGGRSILPRVVDSHIWRTLPDRVILQTSWEYVQRVPGPKLGLQWLEEQVKKTCRHIPPWKLMVALPVDGVVWRIEGPWREYNYLSHDDARRLAYQRQAKIQWDIEERVPYYDFMTDQGRCRVWFENKDSIGQKLTWLSYQHLGGIVITPTGGEDSRIWREIEEQYRQTGVGK